MGPIGTFHSVRVITKIDLELVKLGFFSIFLALCKNPEKSRFLYTKMAITQSIFVRFSFFLVNIEALFKAFSLQWT